MVCRAWLAEPAVYRCVIGGNTRQAFFSTSSRAGLSCNDGVLRMAVIGGKNWQESCLAVVDFLVMEGVVPR
jgi:hypothetical protein